MHACKHTLTQARRTRAHTHTLHTKGWVPAPVLTQHCRLDGGQQAEKCAMHAAHPRVPRGLPRRPRAQSPARAFPLYTSWLNRAGPKSEVTEQICSAADSDKFPQTWRPYMKRDGKISYTDWVLIGAKAESETRRSRFPLH